MNHYCTYFDRGYLAQGLALWESLARHDPMAILWTLALDEDTARALRGAGRERLRVLTLHEIMAADPELAATQAGRSRREFIFTLTPCLTRHLLRTHAEIGLLMYVDADLFFFGSPEPIWQGLGTGSILVVAHRFPAWHDRAADYGRFNVGVLIFRDDASGRACLDWWRACCLESCALTADGTHFGDQKYLDEWPRRFAGVVELEHPGVNVAPWNWARHRFELRDGHVVVDGTPLVVFHFAQFRLIGGRWFDSGQLEFGIMPAALRSRLYGEYWAALTAAESAVRGVLPGFRLPAHGWRRTLEPWHWGLLRIAWGQYWWRGRRQWWAGRFGLGRFAGRVLGKYRRRQNRAP